MKTLHGDQPLLRPAGFIILVLLLGASPFMVPATGVQSPLVLGPPQAPLQSSCLSPSPADASNSTIRPSPTNSQIPDFVPSTTKATAVSSMPPTFMLHMEFVFAIRNPTAFQACLNAIQDPNSLYYHEFLNGLTLEPYVPTPAQKSSVISYFEGKGLAVKAGSSPLVLEVAGSVASVQSIFSTSIELFSGGGGRNFYAPSTYPSMPSNLAAMGIAIEGMDNYSRATPSESPCTGPYCPQGIQIGYSLSSLISGGHTGSGVTVAVVDEPGDQNIQTAINTYDTIYSLPPIALSIKEPDGAPSSWDPGWASEAAMDVEALHTTAPGAGIVVAYGNGLDDPVNMIDYVASNHLANIASNSWSYSCSTGSCSDTQLSSSLVSAEDSRLAIDAAQGLTIVFATGDQGATPDGSHFGVEFPGSDVNVLAVGATNLVLAGSCNPTCTGYGSESGAAIGGGGYSGYFGEPYWQSAAKPALSGRGVPDVSMLGYNPGYWVYSTLSDKCGTSVPAAGWFGCAGTSLATPLWAGVIAIIDQAKGGGPMGNIAPSIWQLANSPAYSSDFHDVTTGNNNDGAGGYSAAAGWDPSTGWGSPIASALVPSSSTSTTTTTASTSTASTTATSTTTIIVTATATSTVVNTVSSTSTITNIQTTTIDSTSTTFTPVTTTTVSNTVTTTTAATSTATLSTTIPTTSTSTSTALTTVTTTIPASTTSTSTVTLPTTTTSTSTVVASTTATHTTTLTTTVSAPTTTTISSTSYTTLTSTVPTTATSTVTLPKTTTSTTTVPATTTSTTTAVASTTSTHTTTLSTTVGASTTTTATSTASTTVTSTLHTTTTSVTTMPTTTVSTVTIPATTTSTITVPASTTTTQTSTVTTPSTTVATSTSYTTLTTTVSATATTTSTSTVAASTTSIRTTTLTSTLTAPTTTTATNTIATSTTSTHTTTLFTTLTAPTTTTVVFSVTTTHTSVTTAPTTTIHVTTTSTSTARTTVTVTTSVTTVTTTSATTSRSSTVTTSNWVTTSKTITRTCTRGFC